MSSFLFTCPFCGKNLDCDESLDGRIAECPSCHKEIVPDAPKVKTLNNRVDPAPKNADCSKDIPSSDITAIKKQCWIKYAILSGVIIATLFAGIGIGIAIRADRQCGEKSSATVIEFPKNTDAVASVSQNTPTIPRENNVPTRNKMLQINIINSPDWSNPTPDMLHGMRKNELLSGILTPLVESVEKLYPKTWDMRLISQASRCLVNGDPAQMYLSGKITDDDTILSVIIQLDDSDDKYNFVYYATTDRKVCVEFAITSSFFTRNIISLNRRLEFGSTKKKSEKIDRPSIRINGVSYFGSCEFKIDPSNEYPVSAEFYNGEWLNNIQMSKEEFCRFSMALLAAQKKLNDYHFKKFYFVQSN